MLAGGALIALSPFLPWVRVSAFGLGRTESFADYLTDTDKSPLLLVLVFVIAAAAALGGGLRARGQISGTAFRLWVALAGLAGLGEALYQFREFRHVSRTLPAVASARLDTGYFLLVLGCALVLAALALDRKRPPAP